MGPPSYIKSKLVHLRPWLWRFLQIARTKWWVVVWSSMKVENTNAVVVFIFESPCLVLEHEACRVLYTTDSKVVKKPNNPASPQYLKVLKPIFWA
jgi:hypothetical protein